MGFTPTNGRGKASTNNRTHQKVTGPSVSSVMSVSFAGNLLQMSHGENGISFCATQVGTKLFSTTERNLFRSEHEKHASTRPLVKNDYTCDVPVAVTMATAVRLLCVTVNSVRQFPVFPQHRVLTYLPLAQKADQSQYGISADLSEWVACFNYLLV